MRLQASTLSFGSLPLILILLVHILQSSQWTVHVHVSSFLVQTNFVKGLPVSKGRRLDTSTSDSVAQAVNVISLSAFRDFFPIHVILRGDAYALSEQERSDIALKRSTPGGLSSKTVRADFDPPRIVLGRLFNIAIGPTSSVILDTPYCDERVRLGKGSRGSWFVFERCFDDEANDWKEWIAQRPLRKSRALAAVLTTGCLGVGVVACRVKGIVRVGGAALSIASLLSAILIGFSSGGIEQDKDE